MLCDDGIELVNPKSNIQNQVQGDNSSVYHTNCYAIFGSYNNLIRRRIFWYTCIKSKGNYSSYNDYKSSWDSNTRVLDEINSNRSNFMVSNRVSGFPTNVSNNHLTSVNDYPVPLTIRNKGIKPSDIWSRLTTRPGNENILPTDSSSNLSRRSIDRNSGSVYYRSVGLNNHITVLRLNDSDNLVSLNYRSKHMQSVNYIEAREGILAKMRENYLKDDLGLYDNEVIVINDRKTGKVKLGFKDVGEKFNNGVRKIKSLYVKYEGIGIRKIYWNIFEVGTDNYESYADFKKSWDSKKGLWKHIKDRVKTDIKMDVK
jgi:hypothetical protein